VSCDYSRTVLHGYLDGELDAARAADFERHLETCAECTLALGAEESLRTSLQRVGFYERAPAALRQKVRADLDAATVAPSASRIPAWRWVAVAAGILVVASVSWYAIPLFRGTPNTSSTVTAAQILDAHMRSLQFNHLTDVTSTDKHTVKPWFDGKLDFVPPVNDFADHGFPLVGGRLDVLNGQSVAALVYGRRKHFINVFVWPTKEPDTPIHPPGSRQGFQWVHWRHRGMEFCAVSDVSASELHELAQLFYD
jgi:mycothiol system anti-sigma-R factor